jgi:sulfur-oxidizing protein SoxY
MIGNGLSRRSVLCMGLAAPLLLRMRPAGATPEAMQAAIDEFTGGAEVQEGRVTLDIPMLVQNGNAVPLTVSVESPMTDDDFVETIAIFNEVNPLPNTVRFHFNPASGRAQTQTRIRLNGDQHVHAVARMSDGSHWTTNTNVIVTAPACRES